MTGNHQLSNGESKLWQRKTPVIERESASQRTGIITNQNGVEVTSSEKGEEFFSNKKKQRTS